MSCSCPLGLSAGASSCRPSPAIPCTLPPAAPAVYAQSAEGAACPGTTLPTLSSPLVRQVVFAELAPSGRASVGALFNRCSYQKTQLNTTNSVVTEIVSLPCTGTTE